MRSREIGRDRVREAYLTLTNPGDRRVDAIAPDHELCSGGDHPRVLDLGYAIALGAVSAW